MDVVQGDEKETKEALKALQHAATFVRQQVALDLDLRHAPILNFVRDTVEENAIMGGAGSAVLESLHAQGLNVPVLQLGLPDHFVEHGDPAVLLADCGLNKDGIIKSTREWLLREEAKHPSKMAVS